MRGMEYLTDRPGCEFPELVKINRWHKPDRHEHRLGWARRKRDSARRSTSDKTGQATRLRQRDAIISRWGNVCHICWSNGITDTRATIDLSLAWPHPRCFTRDHYVPRSRGGQDTIDNLRPAHHECNARRGDGPVVFADTLIEEAA